jgi:hypothetical protein
MQLLNQERWAKDLLDAIGISTQEYSTAYTYIHTLQNRKSLGLQVNYLNDENILKTVME